MKDTEQRENNYIQEIHTLERHIDHLTHQLELAHKAMRDLSDEKEAMNADFHN
jgi:chromosome segregation ATPase